MDGACSYSIFLSCKKANPDVGSDLDLNMRWHMRHSRKEFIKERVGTDLLNRTTKNLGAKVNSKFP